MDVRLEENVSPANQQVPSPPPLMFYDYTAVICAPVTLQQVVAFNPRERSDVKRIMQDGSEYYGDHLLDEPHGLGIMLFKDGSGPYATGDRYGGGWKNGQFHGEGVLITSAFTYQGGWFEGKMHGRGQMNYNRSVANIVLRGISIFSPFDRTHAPLVYIGDFHQMHCRHGHGMMRYENGDVYEGSWASNHRNGQGKLVCENGEIYEGGWNNDERHGYGKIQYVDGGVFKGMMVHDKRHGEGVMLFPNGDEYYGDFSNNQIAGQGTMRYKNGDVYEGIWEKGLRNGEGKFTLRKQGATMRGCFVNGLIQGRGVLQHPGVSTFVGEFDRGERTQGTLFWDDAAQSDRACYQGEWLGEVMHGKGLLWYRNGDFYFGQFVKNARHGVGNIRYANGSEYSGSFRADMREGLGILQTNSGSIQSGVWYHDTFSEGYDGEWDGKALNGIGCLLLRNPHRAFSPKSLSGMNGKGGNSQGTNAARAGVSAAAAGAQPGTSYFGLFYNGVRHGTGILKHNGHTIIGRWENDELECEEGAWLFPSGDMYVGGFSGGMRQGPLGRVWLSDGSYFSGAWSRDAPSGPGTFHAKDHKSPIYSIDNDESKPENATDKTTEKGSSSGLWGVNLVMNLFRRKSTTGDRDTRSVIGFNDHYVMHGEWDAVQVPYALYQSLVSSPTVSAGKPPATIVVGMQERDGCVHFASGVRVHTEWLHHYPRLWLPHRADAPLHNKIYNPSVNSKDMGEQKCCTFCEKNFAFFRKETVCTVCQRYSCSSCLHPIEVRGNPKIEALVRLRMGLDASGSSLTAQVPACVDCARTVLLSIHFSAIWVPMSYFTENEEETTAAGPSSDRVINGLCGTESTKENSILDKSGDPIPRRFSTGESPTPAADSDIPLGNSPATHWTPALSSASLSDSTPQPIIPSPPALYVVYQGYTCNGIPHIYGSLWWGKDAFYLGAFEHGRRHGSGEQMMRNGERYVGEFKDDAWHGVGTYCALDGSAYQGLWKCGKLITLHYHGEVDECCQRHGKGQSYESDGSRYNGEWQHGCRHGTGILQDAKGVVYSGEFFLNRIEGEGKLVQEASVYFGSFQNGKKHGKGLERFGECAVEGEWRDDMLCGFVRIFDCLTEEVYETTYRDGNERDDCFVPPIMADDEHNPQCAQCGAVFSLFARRHHCRLCGDVVCNSCSQRRAVMPTHFKMEVPQRVCDRCFRRIEQRRMLCIQRYSNGEIYAGCCSQREWVSRGLFRRTDGSVVIMDARGQPFAPRPLNTLPTPLPTTTTTTNTTNTTNTTSSSSLSPALSSPQSSTTPAALPAEEKTMDAAPSREQLRTCPASPQTEVDAFGLWWSMIVSVAGLSLPLALGPPGEYVFPHSPVMRAPQLFSDHDEAAAALRAAMYTPAIAPPPPEAPPRSALSDDRVKQNISVNQGMHSGEIMDSDDKECFAQIEHNSAPPMARPPLSEEAATVRVARERVERFPAFPPPSPEGSGVIVLACNQPRPMLPPTPARPQRDTHERVPWDDWQARPVVQYQKPTAMANDQNSSNAAGHRSSGSAGQLAPAPAEGTAGLRGEVRRVPFACSFLPPVVEDIDHAVRVAPKWRPAPLEGPFVFTIVDTHAKGVVVEQKRAN